MHVFSAPHLCSLHISMVLIVVPKSMVDISFRTPPDHSTFNGGGGGGAGGGSEIADKTHTHLEGLGLSVQIYGQHWITDP
jgi:hypothetical protein